MDFRRLLFLVKVEGLSCWPYLVPGKSYLATSISRPRKGDFIVFRERNRQKFLVKKVIAKENNMYHVSSVLSLARKKEKLGPVPENLIEGKLIY